MQIPINPDANAPADLRAVLSVSLLVGSVRLILERQIGLVWVSGEISGFTRAASGHCYFRLKDAQAQVACVFFRHKAQFAGFPLKDGLAVEVRATASLYEARGEFQLNVETVRLAGQGALYEKFARLKARLEAEGWFAAERKRPLPAYPKAVGIVTSTRAAALEDMLTTFARRWPALRVIIYPAGVQGDGAAAEIARAIETANARAEVDVLIVGRGGGSIEDLWAFNEEIVARAVLESAIPVVSAVGHETDFTICDFVADVRAPTPTGAAALVAPDKDAVQRDVANLRRRWRHAVERGMDMSAQRTDILQRRLVHPAARILEQHRATRALRDRLERASAHLLDGASGGAKAVGHRFLVELRRPLQQIAALPPVRNALARSAALSAERATVRIDALARSLAHLSPAATLERGYAIVTTAGGAIVRNAQEVAVGDPIAVEFARGRAGAKVTKVEN